MEDKKIQIAGYEYVVKPVIEHSDMAVQRRELLEQRRITLAGNWAKRKVIDILQRQTRRRAFRLIIEECVNEDEAEE